MKISNALIITALAAATLPGGVAGAQTSGGATAGNAYYENTPWPLPGDGGTSAFKLNGMTSVHAVWMSFTRYADGKPTMDSPVITLLPGSTTKWTAPEGGCNYELELVNANPPVINMKKPSSLCSLKPGAQVVFRILATP
jgi:hypothetical protein